MIEPTKNDPLALIRRVVLADEVLYVTFQNGWDNRPFAGAAILQMAQTRSKHFAKAQLPRLRKLEARRRAIQRAAAWW